MIPWLDETNPYQAFPDPKRAPSDLNGLVALGGCLSLPRLLRGYRNGIFPWYSIGDPICWWCPDPRTVLYPDQFKASRSLRKSFRKQKFTISADTCFDKIIEQCAAHTPERPETWITSEMEAAYRELHAEGFAHSIEIQLNGDLVGGLYGVALGRVFFGESMFSRISDGSKIALAMLCIQLKRWGFALIDCQMPTEHLHRLGARDIPRDLFLHLLDVNCNGSQRIGRWHLDSDLAL